MTQNEIIEMARQAGLPEAIIEMTPIAFETFAKLVVEKEREVCAKLVEEYETNNDIADTWLNIVSEVIRARGQA
jgi:methyl coenzyme M reductase subunit C